MKRENFITLVTGVAGGLLFGLGMCMCLLPEWNAFAAGVAIGAIGAIILITMFIIRRRMSGKPPVKLSPKAVGIIAYSMLSALIFGLGMCMTMVWEGVMMWGIIVGIIGIIMLICLIPMCKGLH